MSYRSGTKRAGSRITFVAAFLQFSSARRDGTRRRQGSVRLRPQSDRECWVGCEMTAPNPLVVEGALIGLRDSLAELPLDGPVGWLLVVFFGVAIPAGPWVTRVGLNRVRRGYTMIAADPVGAGDAHLESGVVEVKGTAKSLGETTAGKYTGEPALAQKWHEEREEEGTDADGNTTTSWRTTDRGSDAVPFLIEDETGSIAVDAPNAALTIDESNTHEGPTNERWYEGRIEPGDSAYVFGQLEKANDRADAPGEERAYIGDGEDAPEFLVSDSGGLGIFADYVVLGGMLVAVGIGVTLLLPVLFLITLEEAFGVPTASWLLDLL